MVKLDPQLHIGSDFVCMVRTKRKKKKKTKEERGKTKEEEDEKKSTGLHQSVFFPTMQPIRSNHKP